MVFLQKRKQTIKSRYLSWLAIFISFTGLLVIALLYLIGDSRDHSVQHPALLKLLLAIFTLAFITNYISQYLYSQHHFAALSELTQSLSLVENEIASTLLPKQVQEVDIKSITKVLNHSLDSLNEKSIRLKTEMERNERLSENISEFYRQMRALREADFKFDFFEYEIESSVFIFLSGMVTTLNHGVETNEITSQSLLNDYGFEMSHYNFMKEIDRCIRDDIPLNFECSVLGKENKRHWLKFWGRVSKDEMRITGAITDITREVLERNIEKERAIHDNMTGFYNRNALSEIAGKAITESAEDEIVVFVYIGLTGYQEFQERFGMVAGNTYIRVCADVFKKFLKAEHIPFRWWGSDFLLLVKGVKNMSAFRKNAHSIIKKIEKYTGEVDGIAVSFPIAIGYSASRIHGEAPAELLEYASFAEHEALRGDAASPNEFNRERFEEARRASLRRTFIKDIIDRNQLGVVFQPIVSLRTGELFGFEALSRPGNPIYRNIVELIDDAEASGHYAILEKRMVYNALDAYMERPAKFKDKYLFINTAPYATLDEKDYNDIRDRYFGHMKVVFEVVERNRMDPDEINLRKSIVTKAGAKFALDDFGSGYSNHLALLALEPDIIKIDREMVRGIDDDLRKQHMLEDIISYSRYRGTRVLAEGVETRDELETLCRMGIDYAQGFYAGIPLPVLMEPQEKAQEVIRSISRNNQINMKQATIIIQKSLALVDEELARNVAITTFLVMKLAGRIGFEGDKLAGLVITTLLHDIGILYPGCEEWRIGKSEEISGHSIFAYLLLKEFSPFPEYVRAVLYHHKKYNNRSNVFNNTAVPDEAYLLSLADAVSDMILNSTYENLCERILDKTSQSEFKPEYVTVLQVLCDEGLLSEIVSGEYQDELLSYMGALKLGKAEIESIIRTFIYGATFSAHRGYSHVRTMETTVSIMARLSKQNWNLLEKVRIAALLYNLGMLTLDKKTLEKLDSPEEEHRLLNGELPKVSNILKEADLVDIMDMLNGVIGDKNASEKRMLMGKDIINGCNMLNLADVFARLIEKKSTRPDMTCQDALDELRLVAVNNNLYLPMIEMMEDFIEDIEARVNSNRNDMEKRYQNVISSFEKLKERIAGNS